MSDQAQIEKGIRDFATVAGIDLGGVPATAISTIASTAAALVGVLAGNARKAAEAVGKAAEDAITTPDQAEAAEKDRR